jgi:hypothetical protein
MAGTDCRLRVGSDPSRNRHRSAKLDAIVRLLETTMKKKRKSDLTAEFWARDAREKQELVDRIAYHERRLKEEREKREKR